MGIKKKILIFEAEGFISSTKDILSKEGYNAELVRDGFIALDRIQNYEYDMILIDFKYDVTKGMLFSERFRKEDKFVPIIAMISTSCIDERETIINSGINDVVLKPCRKNELLYKVQKYI